LEGYILSRVGPLILFGFTIVAGGLYWALWDSCREYLDSILIQDVYYDLMYWGFRIIPAVLLIIAIMCLIASGIGRSKQVVEY